MKFPTPAPPLLFSEPGGRPSFRTSAICKVRRSSGGLIPLEIGTRRAVRFHTTIGPGPPGIDSPEPRGRPSEALPFAATQSGFPNSNSYALFAASSARANRGRVARIEAVRSPRVLTTANRFHNLTRHVAGDRHRPLWGFFTFPSRDSRNSHQQSRHESKKSGDASAQTQSAGREFLVGFGARLSQLRALSLNDPHPVEVMELDIHHVISSYWTASRLLQPGSGLVFSNSVYI